MFYQPYINSGHKFSRKSAGNAYSRISAVKNSAGQTTAGKINWPEFCHQKIRLGVYAPPTSDIGYPLGV